MTGKRSRAFVLMTKAIREQEGLPKRGVILRDGDRSAFCHFIEPAAVAETGPAFVMCLVWREPPVRPDNERSPCTGCGVMLQHRPDVPRRLVKVCMACMEAIDRPN